MRPNLSDFEGLWQLDRTIQDAAGGQTAQFTGTAQLTRDDAGLIYEETGQLKLAQSPALQATRRYLWRAGPKDITGSHNIDVYFADGRFFHSIAPEPAPQAQHWCDPDDYDVRYEFGHWPRWSAHWRVTGPRKSYQMVSHYSK